MSQLTNSRTFFQSYTGPSVTIKTKHAEFVCFDKDNTPSLDDVLNYQAVIDGVEQKRVLLKRSSSQQSGTWRRCFRRLG